MFCFSIEEMNLTKKEPREWSQSNISILDHHIHMGMSHVTCVHAKHHAHFASEPMMSQITYLDRYIDPPKISLKPILHISKLNEDSSLNKYM